MDELIKQGQWWWLVIPSALALFGSWLGTRMGKSTEHQQWLRNQKKETYISVHNLCAEDQFAIQRFHPLDTEGLERRKEINAELMKTDLDMIAPTRVINALSDYNQLSILAYDAQILGVVAGENAEVDKTIERTLERLRFSRRLLLHEMRADLGVHRWWRSKVFLAQARGKLRRKLKGASQD